LQPEGRRQRFRPRTRSRLACRRTALGGHSGTLAQASDPCPERELTYDVAVIPRRNLVAAGVFLLIAITLSVWTHDYIPLIVGAVVFAVMTFRHWQRGGGSG
jgi:hypothetical protein